MIAHPFAYARPANEHAAAHLLANHGGDAAVLGGGTWLLPHMGRTEMRPSLVVDLRNLGLRGVRQDGDTIVIGSTTTYDDLLGSPLVHAALPLLAIMARGVSGGPGISGQGTIGGSACYATPASDAPGCLVALGARLRLVGVNGTRDVPAGQFFTGPFQTARRPDEFLAAIIVGRPAGRVAHGYHKLKLSGSSWPIVTASCCLHEVDGGVEASVTIGAASRIPVSTRARLALVDQGSVLALAARAGAAVTDLWEDELADAAYRLAVAPEVARRAATGALDALRVR